MMDAADAADDLPVRLAADLAAAFPAAVEAHADRLYTIAIRLLGDASEAEEATQDAFLRAFRALDTWPPGRIREVRLRPWLASIVVNACRTRARRRARRQVETRLDGPAGAPAVLTLAVADPGRGPEQAATSRETARELTAHLTGLPERYRVAVVLRHVDGLGYGEMAEALGVPEGTLKARVHRGLGLLRAAIEANSRAAEAAPNRHNPARPPPAIPRSPTLEPSPEASR